MNIYMGGNRIILDPKQIKGSGGEADIFLLNNGDVAKIYKDEKHPSFVMDDKAKEAAVKKIKIMQQKLPALMKIDLPSEVVKPKELIYDKNKQIIGYTMNFIDNAELLSKYFKNRKFRQSIDNNQIVNIFKKLHPVVNNVHQSGIILGDFNDTNVMASLNGDIYLIDIDSSQFTSFLCHMFSEHFVDPLLCDISDDGKSMIFKRPHNKNSDWYAFSVMAFRNFLLIHSPFAGVHHPKIGEVIPNTIRPIKNISVFDDNVTYPSNSLHYSVLPDDLLEYFQKTFVKNKREIMPLDLLEKLRWTKCSNCGKEHARNICPNCAISAPALKEVIRGNVTATNIFRTSGKILESSFQKNKMQWIYHENGKFCRNNNIDIIPGDLDPHLTFKICNDINILAKKDQMVILRSLENPEKISISNIGSESLYDTNSSNYFWITGNQLFKNDILGTSKYLGSVLENQTRFWVGEDLGFGFYRAGGLFQCFIIDIIHGGINDNIQVNSINGNLLDYDCFFGNDLIWFFLTIKIGNKDVNICHIFDKTGKVLLSCDDSGVNRYWLENIHGFAAYKNCLFSSTDSGIVKLEYSLGSINIAREYPDTVGFVGSGDLLYLSSSGIYVVNDNSIKLLSIK